MRILQIVQKPQLRGAEIFACQLSNHLLTEGCDVHMIVLFPGEAILPFKGALTKLNRPISKRLIDFEGWKMLAEHIKEFKPEVVQANAGDTLKFAVLSKLFFRWRTPIIFRNASKVSDFIDSWPKLVFNKFITRYVTHVISVSELCRKDFLCIYLYKPEKSTTVPIGIEIEPVNPSVQSDLKKIFNSGKVLVNTGSFVPEKNHKGLLNIVEKLVNKDESIKAVLIGDGKLRKSIELEITDRKLDDSVFLLGYRTDVMSIIPLAKAFILPSKIEGLPGVILEAMYSRVPVVAYDVGGISELVKNGLTGWLVPPDDEEGFITAILEALNAPGLEVIKETAYKTVVTDYDNRTIAKRFLDVYRRVI